MPAAHIDFELVGEVTLTVDEGLAWRDTGIGLPDDTLEALVVQVGSAVSHVFDEERITDTEPVTAGSSGSSGGVSMADIAANFPQGRLGHSAATDTAPNGTLMIAVLGAPTVVRLWHLTPVEIDQSGLTGDVLARLLPAVSEAQAGGVLTVGDDGEWTVGDPAGGGGGDGLTVAGFRARFGEFAARSDADVAAAVATAGRIHNLSEEIEGWVAAHVLAISGERTGLSDGGSGEIQAESLGPVSRQYVTQAATAADTFFSTTSYGRMVLTLEGRHPQLVVPVVVA